MQTDAQLSIQRHDSRRITREEEINRRDLHLFLLQALPNGRRKLPQRELGLSLQGVGLLDGANPVGELDPNQDQRGIAHRF